LLKLADQYQDTDYYESDGGNALNPKHRQMRAERSSDRDAYGRYAPPNVVNITRQSIVFFSPEGGLKDLLLASRPPNQTPHYSKSHMIGNPINAPRAAFSWAGVP
jgi:hypothetical protein